MNTDDYDRFWDPEAYLQHFYRADFITDDEKVNAEFIIPIVASGKYRHALEIGCGPTLHHAGMIAPYVETIDMSDYLKSNLDIVQQELKHISQSHRWDKYFDFYRDTEKGHSLKPVGRDNRKEMLQKKCGHFISCDLTSSPPFTQSTAEIDLFISFYCAEAISYDISVWRSVMKNLSKIVTGGKSLLMTALISGHKYPVGRNHLPITHISETQVIEELELNGFTREHIKYQTTKINDIDTEAGTSVMNVLAYRKK